MNQSLSAFLLFGVLLSLPLTVGGQETNSIMARRIIFNGPSFQPENPTESSRVTSPSVSARELSIPERAVKAYRKGTDRLSKNDPGRQPRSFPNAPLPNFRTFMRLTMRWVWLNCVWGMKKRLNWRFRNLSTLVAAITQNRILA
jgi:hypothetical protein